jgi:hypothetical protein
MQEVDGGSPVHERIAELEGRLQRMEKEHLSGSHARGLMSRIVPPEASNHFRAAGREQLMGVRALMDHWIHRLEERAEPRQSGREEIPIE